MASQELLAAPTTDKPSDVADAASRGFERPKPGTSRPKRKHYQHRNQKQDQHGPIHKRQRFPDYKSDDQPGTKALSQPDGSMVPIYEKFRLQISILGLDRISSYCYDIIKSRENRFPDPPYTRDQFKHICNLAAFFKLYYSAIKCGLYNPNEYPSIIDDCQTIEAAFLPNIVCDYISCIGKVLQDSMVVVPHARPMVEFFQSRENPFYVLNAHGDRTDERCTIENFMDQYTVGTYNRWNLRAKQLLHYFRQPKILVEDGLPEMLVSTGIDPRRTNRVYGESRMPLPEEICRRGAAFVFWNSEDNRENGDYEFFVNTFLGESFDAEAYLSTIVNSSIC